MPSAWICPFCGRHATIGYSDHKRITNPLLIPNKHGLRYGVFEFIVCPNPDCQEYTLSASIAAVIDSGLGQHREGELLESWPLVPSHQAKVFPSYVPGPILEDYIEACKIRDLSPKASATLSRRCLQGIIRDFWQIKKARLIDEIEALQDKVDPLTWEAIDAVRKIGNIGAHMEKDINVIVDVEPSEAQHLIGLIELLIEEWYVHRYERQKKLEAIKAIAVAKEKGKKTSAP